MSDYTSLWERRPEFGDNGIRRRTSATLAEAISIMQMAYMVEPGFRAISITDTAGQRLPLELTDPCVSEPEYLNHGFDDNDSWTICTVNEP